MAAIDFAHLLLVIPLYFTIVLTSSHNSATETDVVSSASFLDQDHPSKPSLLSPTVNHFLDDDISGKKNSTSISVMAEGGPIPVSTSVQHADIRTVTKKIKGNVSKERNAAPSIVARKGVKPRKGVNETELNTEQTSFQIIPENIKPIAESTSTMQTTQVNNQFGISNVNIPKLTAINSHSNDSLGHNVNSSLSSIPVNISHTSAINNTTMSKSSTHQHIPKPKPTVTTIGRAEINESRASLRNKNPPLGMPRKIDYIVPVIITIIVLPLLGAAIFIMYKRGRDCWDKRHYRRMDFLIDGMYND